MRTKIKILCLVIVILAKPIAASIVFAFPLPTRFIDPPPLPFLAAFL
jgi:hypothetical protein